MAQGLFKVGPVTGLEPTCVRQFQKCLGPCWHSPFWGASGARRLTQPLWRGLKPVGTAPWGQRCCIQWWNTPEWTMQHITTASREHPTTGHYNTKNTAPVLSKDRLLPSDLWGYQKHQCTQRDLSFIVPHRIKLILPPKSMCINPFLSLPLILFHPFILAQLSKPLIKVNKIVKIWHWCIMHSTLYFGFWLWYKIS